MMIVKNRMNLKLKLMMARRIKKNMKFKWMTKTNLK